MIRVLIADDNAVIRQGLAAVLASSGDIEVVGDAATGRQAIERAADLEPDVVLLDVRMPVMDGVAAVGSLARSTKVLMLTHAEEPEIVTSAIRNGAVGYLVHGQFEPAELAGAVRAVARREAVLSPAAVEAMVVALQSGDPVSVPDQPDHDLTDREAEVMDHIARGLSNAEIAGELFLAEKTVKNHINSIYTKLAVTSRAQAIVLWIDGDGRAAG